MKKRYTVKFPALVTKFEDWGILKKVRDKDGGLYRVERIIKAKAAA